ncbi:MAG: DUF2752 domain-containing protein [Tepidisphaeraceae bacterium]
MQPEEPTTSLLTAHCPPHTPLPIYNHNFPSPKIGAIGRLIGAGLATLCVAVLATAAWLVPSGTGVETHRQLGLAPCGLLATTGVPCMTCGMTTSFAFFAHGNVLASLWVQPGGTVLAFMAAMIAWAGGYIAFTGLPGPALLNRVPFVRIVFITLGVLMVAWTWKIIIHARGMDGW